MSKEKLIKAAMEATKHCHIPYSHFPVGAAILLKNGQIIPGANIENSSYGLSMCAERTALYHAHLQGYRRKDIVAMAVVGKTSEPISPCGACRQVMIELLDEDTPIYLANDKNQIKETNPGLLLPGAFTSKDLKTK